ncbi:MAG: flagellar hook-associated protein FlgK [Spirochaetales bacterium]|nr:flagellar hook-associated protein FlgK [Spirochaetales bacterium]
MSTFTGIEIGKRSLITHTTALNTVGHNISNAGVEGYSRQRVEMKATDPLYVPGLNREETPGQIGQGMETQRIERVKDMLLEGRIVAESNGLGYWKARDNYILMLEQVHNEPYDISVRGFMDRFWESWQDLNLHPEEMSSRKAIVERGKALTDAIHNQYNRFKSIRDMAEGDIKATVGQVNEMIREIAALNEQILKSEALGDNPNDLWDKRDMIVNNLSELVDVTIGNRDPDEYVLNIGGMHLIQGRIVKDLRLEGNPENEGYSRVLWDQTSQDVVFRGGKLAALLELRDGDIKAEIQKLDLMSMNFVDLVNEIHSRGYGLNKETGNNFFIEYPFIDNASGNYDFNSDGAEDSSLIFRIDGSNKLNPKEQIGLAGVLTLPGATDDVTIQYFPSDTVEDLINRINLSGAEVVARLNQEGVLSLKGVPSFEDANPDFVIRHLEDSGLFLSGYTGILRGPGAANAFDWQQVDAVNQLTPAAAFAVAPLTHPSSWIALNPVMENDPGYIAANFDATSQTGGPGDGRAALAIANLRTEQVMIGNRTTFDDYFADAVAEIGLKGEQAEKALETENLILKQLKDMRDSISGVNVDEEMANMVKFQHGYTAAARFVSNIDEMLDVIINRMGA